MNDESINPQIKSIHKLNQSIYKSINESTGSYELWSSLETGRLSV